jgi:hypothetical protein
MAPQKPHANYSKRPVKRVRLPKIGPRKTKSLFEEHFYIFLLAISAGLAILLQAGGMRAYDAFVIALWAAGILWFARQAKRYYKERSGPAAVRKAARAVKPPEPTVVGPLPPGMKPMIGPQWPLKPVQKTTSPGNGGARQDVPGKTDKPAFIYERPTLPDRKPKLPANWPGQQDKKPKR